MKISTKIYGGFGLMLVIMLFIVGTFYYQNQIVKEINHDVTHDLLPMQNKAQILALGAAREAAAINGFIASGNPKFKQDLDKATQQVDAALEYLARNAKARESIKPMEDANSKIAPHLKRITMIYDTQGQAAAAAYMANYATEDMADLLAEINKYVEGQQKLVDDDIKSIDDQESKTTITIICILSIGIVIGGVGAVLIARPILASIRQGVNYAEAMAQGIFNQHLEIRTKDEIGILLQSLNSASKSLSSLIKHVADSAESVAAASEELTASAEQSSQASNQVAITLTEMSQGTEKQVYSVNATTDVVKEMLASIDQIAINVNAATGMSDKTANSAREGGKLVYAAIHQMSSIEHTVINSAQVVSRLGERSKEIGQIVDTISGIAGQTNLLALNAAIEAARAGEQGRGFAVVADEVRKLAEQSQTAAKQIVFLVTEIQAETDKAVVGMSEGTREVKVGTEAVNNAGHAFEDITALVNQVSAQIKEISVAIQQMALGSQQIVATVRDIDIISQENAGQTQTVSAATEEQSASMVEIAESSQALAAMAEKLNGAVRKFTI